MTRIRCRLLLLFLLAVSLASAIVTLRLLGRDGVSLLDLVVSSSAAMCAPLMVISLVWIALLPFFGGRESAIPCVRELPAPTPQLGILVPVYKEDMQAVTERLAVTWRSLVDAEPSLALHTRFFVLSDSPAEYEASERHALSDAVHRHALPIWYRRRAVNKCAKPGNVHEFLDSSGAEGLDFVVGFDADSVMSGALLSRLVRILCHPRNADVAIVQTQMVVARPASPLAAAEAWSRRHMGSVGDVVMSRFLGGGNYFGHNYIARPQLLREASGRLLDEPVGGPFPGLRGFASSHDLAEGSILSEMGFRILSDDLCEGSFEEAPPTVPLYLARELRWLRGSLQHVVGGWIGCGGFAQRFVLCACALRHINCLLSALGMLASLAILVRGQAFFGTVSPAWDAGTRSLEWAYTPLPLVLLAITVAALVAPPLLSLWWTSYVHGRSRWGRLGTFLRRLPGLAMLMAYGLFVGPLIAGRIAMAIPIIPFRRSTWTTQRRGDGYQFTDAVRHLSPLWSVGCVVLALGAACPPTVWPFLLILGVPLAASPLTAVLVSRQFDADAEFNLATSEPNRFMRDLECDLVESTSPAPLRSEPLVRSSSTLT